MCHELQDSLFFQMFSARRDLSMRREWKEAIHVSALYGTSCNRHKSSIQDLFVERSVNDAANLLTLETKSALSVLQTVKTYFNKVVECQKYHLAKRYACYNQTGLRYISQNPEILIKSSCR